MRFPSKWRRAIVAVLGGLALWIAAAAGATAWRRHTAAVRERAMAGAAKRLHDFDESRREVTDFARVATWDRQSGADPYLVQEIPGSGFLVGILRGADAVVVLDDRLREVQRLPAPRAPVALAVSGDAVY